MNQVVEQIEFYRNLWNDKVHPNYHFHHQITVRYDLRGRVAGQARWNKKKNEWIIRVNMEALGENYEDYMATTLPHELAHLLVGNAYPSRCKPHGTEWKDTMRVLGIPPERCHHYSYTPARVVTRYPYMCACQIHSVSAVIHKRMQKGQRRECMACKSIIVYSPEADDNE